jgi:hypothetical protein
MKKQIKELWPVFPMRSRDWWSLEETVEEYEKTIKEKNT